MAFNNDHQEPFVPQGTATTHQTADLLPKYYRSTSNKKFLQSTLDQLTQPGTVKKVSGFIGRQSSKATTSRDTFLKASDKARQDYQLEPAAVIKDELGNTTFFKDYIDHINHISVFDGNVDNHTRINQQEFYSWNPHICWDKFTNFSQYYWLPFGPDVINVVGQQLAVISEYTVKTVDEGDNTSYLFTPNGMTRNPSLRLFRGQTYIFSIEAPNQPFSIKTRRVDGSLNRYTDGVSGFAVESGTITFTVPFDAPDVLYYVSETTADTGGAFEIRDIDDNTFLDLDKDVIGKKNYIIPNGTASGLKLSNGMKLAFKGQVTPAQYEKDFWYVEGVGTAIRLINERDLEVRATYSETQSVMFDDMPFDQMPYGDSSTYPHRKDYITINRSSIDNNPWSRYNRWFHESVIVDSAVANNNIPQLDQSARATRPIIEFKPNIKLFNYGITSKNPVDVIDQFTQDVFSTIEGSLGYNIDGIDLIDGMRVLFTADPDIMVKNKIFKVRFVEVETPAPQLRFDASVSVQVSKSIIEFDYDHGLSNGSQLIYSSLDNPIIPGLAEGKVYYVKAVTQYSISLYKDQALTKEVEIFETGTGIHSFKVFLGLRRQITLVEEPDSAANVFDNVSIRFGNKDQITPSIVGNQGQSYWFDGTTWKLCQIKTGVNTPPLFDVFDGTGISYSDYEGSNFSGTRVFGYAVGNGALDSELGFPLKYKNINNTGDIVFEFSLLKDSFAFKSQSGVEYKSTDVGYLRVSTDLDNYTFENGWVTSKVTNCQPIIRIFKNVELPPALPTVNDTYTTRDNVTFTFNGDDWVTNQIPVDAFDNKDALPDLEVRVYINGKRLSKRTSAGIENYSITENTINKVVTLVTPVSHSDVITLKCFAKQKKNQNGYYEIPINLQNNPLNDNITEFTLGEVIDHVDSIVDNITNSFDFIGSYPGSTNLKDLGFVAPYGTRFVQHSGPLNLALYHLGDKSANLIKAIDQARLDYGQFKRAFLIAATNSGIDTDAKNHVDHVLQTMNSDKNKNQLYFLSDMFAYSASNRLEITVLDSRIKIYPLTRVFNLKSLTNTAVYIYLNGEQLTHGRDYVFGETEFFEITTELQEGDLIEIYEYVTTDGCFCPPTPTKLGLYPKFEPTIYVDTSYVEPTTVIRGHDGSITVAFGDYRDQLLLELEKRIFNNIKVDYNSDIFDIHNFVPGFNRTTDYSLDEFNQILSKYFYQWTANISEDFTKNDSWYEIENPFTHNYQGWTTVDGAPVPAAWRGIYKWLLDTDTPHLTPWECLGFSIEPDWWQSVYGPAPYTSDNLILWDDIKNGTIREPGVPLKRDDRFVRPILSYGLPVNESGALLSPRDSGLVKGSANLLNEGYFKFGDQAVVETAWRRSSFYPFALIQTALLMSPSKVIGCGFDRSRIVRNLAGQLTYVDTGLRITLKDLVLPTISNTTTDIRRYTCGLVNYIVDYLTSENTARLTQYASDLSTLTNFMSTRLGGFTNKPKFKLILDSKTPNSSGGVFIPDESYFVDLNVSSAIKKVTYSGMIITKYADGFEIKGYNNNNPYFEYYTGRTNDRVVRIGGISESYSQWSAGSTYVAGKIVLVGAQFYRVKVTHVSSESFDTSSGYYVRLPELPLIGGREAMLKTSWDKSTVNKIAYGTKLATIQEVVDVMQGYGAFLEDQGFVFDDFNNNLTSITNWKTSINEFLFWTTQGWGEGAVISLSPLSNRVVFNADTAVVDDITGPFYGYSVCQVDGQKLPPEHLSVYRRGPQCVVEATGTLHGIYGITLYLVQKEHVVVMDDTTVFNDTVYHKPSGYRQERIKVLGYITASWNGGLDIPGFIYDQAIIQLWKPWTDYHHGDVVKHKEFYYSANTLVIGSESFNDSNWTLLHKPPTSELIPNLDYRAEQFTDFYDLDTDNLDSEQQRIAQHLIGYQKRQYLENIINNDVSQYKFYQGMISEKGTANVLTKLFDVLSADDQESLVFDEEWAVRVGEYGATDTFNEVEFILDETQFKVNPQPLEIVDSINMSVTDFVYRQRTSDVYIKPIGFTKDVWKLDENVPRYLKSLDNVWEEPPRTAVNVNMIKKAYLYNRVTNQLITYLDVVDPLQGKIPGIADQEIKFKAYYDPAVYSEDVTGTKNNSLNYVNGLEWGSAQVGMLWWDLSTAAFMDADSGDATQRATAWNTLYHDDTKSATIDVYEWVRSSMKPDAWDKLAATAGALAQGVDGVSRYGNTAYSVTYEYDSVSQRLIPTYYFWVKNRTIVPSVSGRRLSAFDVARLIADPVGYGYSCLNFVNSNVVSLVNVKKYLQDKDVVLTIQYWVSEHRNGNAHSEWKLISTNKNSVIPETIETKWFDSLVGKDQFNRVVPDIDLPVKQRYGVQYRPRQSMFVNRIEAVKQYIERVNAILKTLLIVDNYDLSDLTQVDLMPSKVSGQWDKTVDTTAELKFVSTALFKNAHLTPRLEDGRITGITIDDPGYGYGTNSVYQTENQTPVSWYGPVITVTGNGEGADLRTVVDNNGSVIDCIINSAGEGYTDQTQLLVRGMSVLVKHDSLTPGWVIYLWNDVDLQWDRVQAQKFNVNDYWEYIDWYASGYNQYVKIDYLLNNTYDLVTTEIPVGSIVKVNNVGTGGWVLMKKYDSTPTTDYTKNFKVIGKERGTIQFLHNIYKTTQGYDSMLYDVSWYDVHPSTELRIILDTVKNKLFVDELRTEYLKLFFASVRYALYEQTYLDWAFKTSFIKATHNVGQLSQKVTYRSDNLTDFESYISEVKPYRTKIREYVSSYSKLDPTHTSVTDFDLPPIIGDAMSVSPATVKVSNTGEVIYTSSEIDADPWVNWKNALGFDIVSLDLYDQGSGYVTAPDVRIEGVQLAGGTPAEARAYISNGKVNRIVLINGGSKWVKAPTVVIDGGLSVGGTPARVAAIIGNSPIRSNYIKVKFDRISKTYNITELSTIEVGDLVSNPGLIGNGSRTQFPLQWAPNIKTDTYSVFLSGVEVLKSEYTLSVVKNTRDGGTYYTGLLTFKSPPESGKAITVNYHKNFEHLSATDRINFYYNPTTGQAGKDLAQLMTGIDYGGVEVTGIGFELNYGWNAAPWASSVWDSSDNEFSDYTVTIEDANTRQFVLPYVPQDGQVINIYVSKFDASTLQYLPAIRIDDLQYSTEGQKNKDALMPSFVGDGVVDSIVLPSDLDLQVYTIDNVVYGDRVIFRKIESDGSQSSVGDYDTKISGGDLAYSTALGTKPEEIVLDGDQFVTPMTSHAPEEVVPGQVMDAVAIKVYTQPTGGAPNILFKNYKGDGITTRFNVGQRFSNNRSVIVKVNGSEGSKIFNLTSNYTIDYSSGDVIFVNAPDNETDICIISVSLAADYLLDMNYFVADGSTTEFITIAPWLPTLNVTVLVDGVEASVEIFNTTSDYTNAVGQSWPNRVGIKFALPPEDGAIVYYMIDNTSVAQTASVIKSETFPYIAGQTTYDLDNPIGINRPFEANVLVKAGNQILNPPSYSYFTLTGKQYDYGLSKSKYQTATDLNVKDIEVYCDGALLTAGVDYRVVIQDSWPLYTMVVGSEDINGGQGYSVGDIIETRTGATTENEIKFVVTSVDSVNGKIWSMQVQSTGLIPLSAISSIPLYGGTGTGATLISADLKIGQNLPVAIVKLRPEAYVDGAQLVIGVNTSSEYRITEENTIVINDPLEDQTPIEVISFYNHNVLEIQRTFDSYTQDNLLVPKTVDYYEFNDRVGGIFRLSVPVVSANFVWVIKNRILLSAGVDYFLENDNQTVHLNEYLRKGDTVQVMAFTNSPVMESFGFMQFKDMLNRVHYKRLNASKTTSLVNPLYQIDTQIEVADGSALDIPNIDLNIPGIIEINGERIEYFKKDGNILTQLYRATLGTGSPVVHAAGTLVQGIGASETIPYADQYRVNTIMSDEIINNDGSIDTIPLPYLPNLDYVSLDNRLTTLKNTVEVFVGGYRLKKDEFIVDINGDILLTTAPILGVRITIIQKCGTLWNDSGQRLSNSTTQAATFIKAVSTAWPK